jgi:L-fuculose-phosphate aldolase
MEQGVRENYQITTQQLVPPGPTTNETFFTNQPFSTYRDAGLFSEYGLPVMDGWNIALGARVDWVETTALLRDVRPDTNLDIDELNQHDVLYAYYLTNAFKLSDTWTFNLGYGYAQRPPALVERYADGVFLGLLQSGFTRVIGNPALAPERICVITLDGEHVDGPDNPSTEVPMHTVVYENTDALAVLHTHPVYATVLGTLVDEMPLIHYMLALLGGPVRVAPYAQFGTEELARNCDVAMRDRYAVLLQNHGATTYGDTLAKAYSRSIYLEWLCRIYCEAKALGEPRLLTTVELDAVAEALSTYGQSALKS